MAQDTRKEPLWNELDVAAAGYAKAKQAFDYARVSFEVAKRRLEVTKQLASQVVPSMEWYDWLQAHVAVRYAGMSIGEAVLDYVRRSTYDFYENATAEEFEGNVPIFGLENFRSELIRGGFEFRTLTPLRELNAALINLSGVKKDGDWYKAANLDEIKGNVKRQQEGDLL